MQFAVHACSRVYSAANTRRILQALHLNFRNYLVRFFSSFSTIKFLKRELVVGIFIKNFRADCGEALPVRQYVIRKRVHVIPTCTEWDVENNSAVNSNFHTLSKHIFSFYLIANIKHFRILKRIASTPTSFYIFDNSLVWYSLYNYTRISNREFSTQNNNAEILVFFSKFWKPVCWDLFPLWYLAEFESIKNQRQPYTENNFGSNKLFVWENWDDSKFIIEISTKV